MLDLTSALLWSPRHRREARRFVADGAADFLVERVEPDPTESVVETDLDDAFALGRAVEHTADCVVEMLHLGVESFAESLLAHAFGDDHGAEFPVLHRPNLCEEVEGGKADGKVTLHQDHVCACCELLKQFARRFR